MEPESSSLSTSNNEDPKSPLLPQVELVPPATTKSPSTNRAPYHIFERALFVSYILAVLSTHFLALSFSHASWACDYSKLLMALDAIRYSSFYAIVLAPTVWLGSLVWGRGGRKPSMLWLLGFLMLVSTCMSYFARLLSMDRLFMRTCGLE